MAVSNDVGLFSKEHEFYLNLVGKLSLSSSLERLINRVAAVKLQECKELFRERSLDDLLQKYIGNCFAEDEKLLCAIESVLFDGYVPLIGACEDRIIRMLSREELCFNDIPAKLRTRRVCSKAMQIDGEALAFIAEADRIGYLCGLAVSQNGLALRFVPQGQRDPDLCLLAVKGAGFALQYVPEEFQNEMIDHAIKKDPWVLVHLLTEEQQTEKRCVRAVSIDGEILEALSPAKRSIAVCRYAVSEWAGTIEFVPEDKLDEAICLSAVCSRGIVLSKIPMKWRTDKVLLGAIANDCRAIQFVSEEWLTYERCLSFVAKNGLALEYLPNPIKRMPEIYKTALLQNSFALSYMPPDLITTDLCLQVVSSSGLALECVPASFRRNSEIYEAALGQNGLALQNVPFDLRTFELCLQVVSSNGLALAYVPDDLKERREIYEAALKQNGLAYRFVPLSIRETNYHLAEEVLWHVGSMLKYVPENIADDSLYMIAVLSCGLALQFIPTHLRSKQLCLCAFRQDCRSQKFVPSSIDLFSSFNVDRALD